MLIRDGYGAISHCCGGKECNESDQILLGKANSLLSLAIRTNKVEASYDGIEKEWRSSKHRFQFSGNAVRHDIYDISPIHQMVLMCVRYVEGSKYGQKTILKKYFLIKKIGSGVQVIEVSKAIVAKAAKAKPAELGYAINVVLGKEKLQKKTLITRRGYKFVTKNDVGEFVSVWDGSSWEIGKKRTECATYDHSGGFYYYKDIETAERSVQKLDVFGDCRTYENLVLIEVEVSGKEYQHPNGQWQILRNTYEANLCYQRLFEHGF